MRNKSSDFLMLARHISGWTTNSLLTLTVLMAGLGFGRQVLVWWGAEDSSKVFTQLLSVDGFGNPSQLHTVQFGDARWQLRRQTIAGNESEVMEQLRVACRQTLQSGRSPTDALLSEEGELLTLLANSTPAMEQPGQWQVYELDHGVPMAVGVRQSSPPKTPSAVTGSPSSSSRRVTVWAIATPTGDQTWTLSMFQPAVTHDTVSKTIPVPPHGHRSFSLSADDGSGIVTFDGPRGSADWKGFYEDWFSRNRWPVVTNWQEAGTGWYATYALPNHRGLIDVRLGLNDRNRRTGILMTTLWDGR